MRSKTAVVVVLSALLVTSQSAANDTGRSSTAVPKTMARSGNWGQRLKQRFIPVQRTSALPGKNGTRTDVYSYDKSHKVLLHRGTVVKLKLPDGTKITSARRKISKNKRASVAEAKGLIQGLSDAKHWQPSETFLADIGQNIKGKKGNAIRKTASFLNNAAVAVKVLGAGARLLVRSVKATRKIDESTTQIASSDGNHVTSLAKARLRDRTVRAKVVKRRGRADVVKADLPEHEDLITGAKYSDIMGSYDAVRDSIARRKEGKEPTRTMLRVANRRLAKLQKKFAAADKNVLSKNRPSVGDAKSLAEAYAAVGKPLSDAGRKELVAKAIVYRLKAGLQGVATLQAGRKMSNAEFNALPETGSRGGDAVYGISRQIIDAARHGVKLPRGLLQQVSIAQTWLEMNAIGPKHSRIEKNENTVRQGPGKRGYLRLREVLQRIPAATALLLKFSPDAKDWAKAWKLDNKQWQQEFHKGLVRSFGQEISQNVSRVQTIIAEQNPYRAEQGKLALEHVVRLQQWAGENGVKFDRDNSVQRGLRKDLGRIAEYRAQLEKVAEL